VSTSPDDGPLREGVGEEGNGSVPHTDEHEPDTDALPGSIVPSVVTARYIGHRFGVETDLTLSEAARGLMGRLWRLGTTGARYALKELFWEDNQDEPQVRRQVAFETAGREVGVRCPESLPTKDGTYLCRMPAELGGVIVRLYTWIDGTSLIDTDEAARWVGETLARLHRLRHPAVGPPRPKFGNVPTMPEWQAVIAALRRERVPWASRLEAALSTVEDLSTLVQPTERDQLMMCHLDLTPANAMRDRSGQFVLLDWDNAGPGSAEQELGSALMEWHVRAGRPRPDAVRDTVTAYESAGGPASIRGLSSFRAYLGATINHLYTQARVTIADDMLVDHQELAHVKVDLVLGSLPSRALLQQVAQLAAREHGDTEVPFT
jgi:Ser/Thr protein kinase RdoA (MazF antagonist)